MSNLFLRGQERRLFRAGLMFRRGRARVVWLNGVLYFGGSLFVLYNAVDYFLEPVARPTPDRKSTRLNSSHLRRSRMPSSA